jgi:hypothetical protein
MFAGLLHPFIHLGNGIEFEIDGIVAEALAQAACHENWIGKLFLGAEERAKTLDENDPIPSLVDLRLEIQTHPTLTKAVEWSDDTKLQSLFSRDMSSLLDIVSRVRVTPDNLQSALKQSINLSAQICGGSTRKDKEIKFDFFLVHCMTSSIFLSVLASKPWISTETKCRLVTRKIIFDLAMYASLRCPVIHLDEITNYQLKDNKDDVNSWLSAIEQGLEVIDDGHSIKMVRAIIHASQVCAGEEEKWGEGWVKGNMWEKFLNMVVDSVKGKSYHNDTFWISGTGFDEAWVDISDRKNAKSSI